MILFCISTHNDTPPLKVIIRCMEAGLVNQWKKRTWARMKAEDGDASIKDDEVSTVVTLDHVQSAFYLYLILMIFAGFFFSIEIFCKWKGDRVNRVFEFTP